MSEACLRKGVELYEILEQIDKCDSLGKSTELVDVDSLSLSELAEHIESTHHAYLRQELPRLDMLTEKVARVHGKKDERLIAMRQAFVDLKNELEPHMLEEEQVLFPLIRQLESSNQPSSLHGNNDLI